MRSKLFAALLAVSAIAALGVGPAAATAGTVQLQYAGGKNVSAGSAVSVESGLLTLGMPPGTGECEPGGILNGESISNFAVGGFFSGKPPKCILRTWSEATFPLEITYFVPTDITFTYGGTGPFQGTGTMPVKYGVNINNGQLFCGWEGTLNVTWTSGQSSFYIQGETTRTSGGAGCALTGSVAGYMSPFDTTNPKEAINIIATP